MHPNFYCHHCGMDHKKEIMEAIHEGCEYFVTLCPILLEIRGELEKTYVTLKFKKPTELLAILQKDN